MPILHVQMKQIVLSVRFLCQIHILLQYQNIQFTVGQHIKLVNGKTTEFKQFILDFYKQVPNLKNDQIENTSGFLQIYLVSNSGKLKIMSKQIKFFQLKQGPNQFNHKFDNCPDRNASISYQIFLQSKSINALKKTIQNTGLSQSNYTLLAKENNSYISLLTPKQNVSIQKDLLANVINGRPNKFIESLQKKQIKTIKKISVQIPRNSKQNKLLSSIQNGKFKSPPILIKNNSNYSSEKQSLSAIKEKLIKIQQKAAPKNIGPQNKIKEYIQELKQKKSKEQSNENDIKLMDQKYRNIQKQQKRRIQENNGLKIDIQRLQQKVNRLKQKNQGLALSNETNLTRFTNKQNYYRQQIKYLTQKITTLQYQKQKVEFQNEILKLQLQKNQQRYQFEIKKNRQRNQQELNETMKKIQNSKQIIDRLNKENCMLKQQIQFFKQKNSSTVTELALKVHQQQELKDQLSRKNLQVQQLKSKIMIVSQAVEQQKQVYSQLSSLKSEYENKQEYISKMQSEISSLKSKLFQCGRILEKQKQANQMKLKQIDSLYKSTKIKQKQFESLKLSNHEFEIRLRSRQSQGQQLFRKNQQIIQEKSNIEIDYQEKFMKLQTQIKLKQNQIDQYETKANQLKMQLTQKISLVNLLTKQLQQKEQTIEQIMQLTQRYEKKLETNQKLSRMQGSGIFSSKTSSMPSKLPIDHISQLSRRPSETQTQNINNLVHSINLKSPELPLRVKKIYSSTIHNLEQVICNYEQVNEQKSSIQKELAILSNSLQKLHTETLQEHSQLVGTSSSLQDKLTMNERLMTRMKLIVQQKTAEILNINGKLKDYIAKYNSVKLQREQMQLKYKGIADILQDNELRIKHLSQQIRQKDNNREYIEKKLHGEIKALQNDLQKTKAKLIQLNKIKTLQSQQLHSVISKVNKSIDHLSKQNFELQQALTQSKIHIVKVSTVFSDVYRQINNIQKQNKVSSFYLVPLRQAIKKVESQIIPSSAGSLAGLKTSVKLQKQGSNIRMTTAKGQKQVNIRMTTSKSPPLSPSSIISKKSDNGAQSLLKSTELKLIPEKNSGQKKQKAISKKNQKNDSQKNENLISQSGK